MPATASTPMASRESISDCCLMPPATMSCFAVGRGGWRRLHGEALHGAFGVDVGVEEGGAGVFEPGDGFFGCEVDGSFQPFTATFRPWCLRRRQRRLRRAALEGSANSRRMSL